MSERTLDVQIVTFHPELDLLDNLLASLQQQDTAGWTVNVRILDNSANGAMTQGVRERIDRYVQSYCLSDVDFVASRSNVGFGAAHNRLVQLGSGAFVLLLNQDVVLEPDALAILLSEPTHAESNVAAWEMRQIPYEHPKDYDPATGEAPWVSGAAVLFRRKALVEVGGFEPRIFLYGEDIELSWRLRAHGWRLHYVARAAVQHLTYSYPGEIKRNQVLSGTLTNLLLRARYGTWRDIARGVRMLCGEMRVPQAFTGRRLGLLVNLVKFAWRLPYFRLTKVSPTADFAPEFRHWDCESRRDGAFHAFKSKRWKPAGAISETLPLVSILIRTSGHATRLRRALSCVVAQTYRPLEVVVVEDGAPNGKHVVDEFADRLNVLYRFTGDASGRAHAGNLALDLATGEYLNCIDDNVLLFADHVEVLVEAARQGSCRAAYALSWETIEEMVEAATIPKRQAKYVTRYRQQFNRIILWHHNYLPLQTVLFHRSLYEQYGGFDPELAWFEEWDLWTRYTLADDFAYVPKTTSKYPAPSRSSQSPELKSQMDAAYSMVKVKQAQMRVEITPLGVSAMMADYLRN
ncbi:MAG: glycosyltransferase family 2 protein [Betaproteobacteria bacterium]